MRRWVRDWVYVPDAQIAWFPAAFRACRRELAEMSDPVLWTTSVPYTCHLVGAALQRRTGVRWVAEFRDPWARAQDAGVRSPRRVALDRRMERAVVTRADAMVFTAQETQDLFAADHGESVHRRGHVVTNTWKRCDFGPPDPPAPHEPLRLVHAGSLSQFQDPRPLIRTVEKINATQPGAVEIHAYGPPEPWVDHIVGLRSVTIHGPIEPSLVPAALTKASGIVMLVPGPMYRAVLAGKTMDWLGSGQPCLGIVEPGGAMARLIETAGGGVVCATNDEDNIEEAIRMLLEAHRAGELDRLRPDLQIAERYELSAVAGQLIDVMTAARVRM